MTQPTDETCNTITGEIEPAYTFFPVDEEFCNPSSLTTLIADGTATANGEFIAGGVGSVAN